LKVHHKASLHIVLTFKSLTNPNIEPNFFLWDVRKIAVGDINKRVFILGCGDEKYLGDIRSFSKEQNLQEE
jgi:hypothetical protein